MGENAKIKKGKITGTMIANFEGNNRGGCLFCESGEIEGLEGYRPDDIPTGFGCSAFWCHSCGRGWREITKFEEIKERG